MMSYSRETGDKKKKEKKVADIVDDEGKGKVHWFNQRYSVV